MAEATSESGGAVETEIWELFDADDAVSDDVAFLVAAALRGDTDLAGQLGADAVVRDCLRQGG